MNRELREHLAIEFDLGFLEATDELAVGCAKGAARGVDPCDPKATEITLTTLTAMIGMLL